jgi:metal-responsive CopG/Arc/MetJ family transcriptional regulator
MKCNKTISIDSKVLERIDNLIKIGKISERQVSFFIQDAVIHELEKYEE